MRLLVTRPEPDALRLKAALEERGHEATVDPLLTLSFEDTEDVDLAGVQAMVATSRNGLRALKAQPAAIEARTLPLFAVGKATAAEARAIGFQTVVTGAGTAHELVTHIVAVLDPALGLLLHLGGDAAAVDLRRELEPHGFRVVQPIVYRMVPATVFSEDTIEQLALGEIDGIILMSPRTASIYTTLVRKHGLTRSVCELPHFCLSAAIARPLAPLRCRRIEVAEQPKLQELLALIDGDTAQSASWPATRTPLKD
jgi:uroporphyrinogen-III synthase